jgi:eight-cysteine-cluster-containing protein
MILYYWIVFTLLLTTTLSIRQSKQFEEESQGQSVTTNLPGHQAQGQAVTEEVPGDITPTNIIHENCQIAGCYNELCISKSENFDRTCTYNFREEFSCFSDANCLINEDGKCSWENTTTLRDCLKTAREGGRGRGRRRPLKCVTTGCSNEFCVEERFAPIYTTCLHRPEFDCLKYTRCSAKGNRCSFERNREFLDCLSSIHRTNESERSGGGAAVNESEEANIGQSRGEEEY